jgi:hypothetical protein
MEGRQRDKAWRKYDNTRGGEGGSERKSGGGGKGGRGIKVGLENRVLAFLKGVLDEGATVAKVHALSKKRGMNGGLVRCFKDGNYLTINVIRAE